MAAENGEEQVLRRQLETVDGAVFFILLLIAAICLSFFSTVIQRRGLALTLDGREKQAAELPDTYPIQRLSGAIVIGATGFFLLLGLQGMRDAAGEDRAARRAAAMNLRAAALVLAAALLRLDALDLREARRRGALLAEPLPD